MGWGWIFEDKSSFGSKGGVVIGGDGGYGCILNCSELYCIRGEKGGEEEEEVEVEKEGTLIKTDLYHDYRNSHRPGVPME